MPRATGRKKWMKQHLGRELNLVPAQVAEFGRPKPMPEGQQDHGRVPVTVAVGLGGLDQGVDLAWRQVLPGTKFGVRASVGATVRFTSVGVTSLRCDFAMETTPAELGLFVVVGKRRRRGKSKRRRATSSDDDHGTVPRPAHFPNIGSRRDEHSMTLTDHTGDLRAEAGDGFTEIRCPMCGSPAFMYPRVLEDDKPVICASCGAFVSTYGGMKRHSECG